MGKDKLTNPPCLAVPNCSFCYLIYTDASHQTISDILGQECKVDEQDSDESKVTASGQRVC